MASCEKCAIRSIIYCKHGGEMIITVDGKPINQSLSRLPDETQEQYKFRRKILNIAIRKYLKGKKSAKEK